MTPGAADAWAASLGRLEEPERVEQAARRARQAYETASTEASAAAALEDAYAWARSRPVRTTVR